jgi:hypothetical protein
VTGLFVGFEINGRVCVEVFGSCSVRFGTSEYNTKCLGVVFCHIPLFGLVWCSEVLLQDSDYLT